MQARAGHDVCDRLGRGHRPDVRRVRPLRRHRAAAEQRIHRRAHPERRAARIRGRPRVLRPGPEGAPRDHGVPCVMSIPACGTRRPRSDPLAGQRPTTARSRTASSSAFDATFTWDYGKGAAARARQALREGEDRRSGTGRPTSTGRSTSIPSAPPSSSSQHDRRMQYVRALDRRDRARRSRSWGEREIVRYAMENLAHRTSQFLHGEQGALLCTARIVETVPWIDAKYYASTQVMDEARHVEVFGRYLDEKMATRYPMNAHLGALIDDVLARLALGHHVPRHADHDRGPRARRVRRDVPDDDRAAAAAAHPLRDERRGASRRVRRAVAAGGVRRASRARELRERQEFVYEAALRMRDRFLHQEVWERLGVSARAMVPYFIRQNRRGGDPLPADAVRQDRAELQEARAARRPRRRGCATGSPRWA